MKKEYLYSLIVLLPFIGCNEQANSLSEAEKDIIKNEVIETYKQHIDDLKRLDYKALMSYYINDPGTALFVDGNYWGGYKKIDTVWADFCEKTDTIIYWNLSDHHVYPLSNDAVSYLFKFDNLRIHKSGDTVMGPGSFSLGLKKINGNWKIATVNATHNYIMAPWLKRQQ